MKIRYAEYADIDILSEHDKHISKEELANSIRLRRIYIAEENGEFAGWLRYNLFWDNTPFMNMLYISEKFRCHGIGRKLVKFWEREMSKSGFRTIMTSTQSNEYAQHFYFKLGYEAAGGFRLDGEPYELILFKNNAMTSE